MRLICAGSLTVQTTHRQADRARLRQRLRRRVGEIRRPRRRPGGSGHRRDRRIAGQPQPGGPARIGDLVEPRPAHREAGPRHTGGQRGVDPALVGMRLRIARTGADAADVEALQLGQRRRAHRRGGISPRYTLRSGAGRGRPR
jgi:hypothetical protein